LKPIVALILAAVVALATASSSEAGETKRKLRPHLTQQVVAAGQAASLNLLLLKTKNQVRIQRPNFRKF
jgi:hypothetical protein